MSRPTDWLATPAHARWLEAEGDRLLEFSRAARHPSGGFAWLDTSGRPALDRPVELWIIRVGEQGPAKEGLLGS